MLAQNALSRYELRLPGAKFIGAVMHKRHVERNGLFARRKNSVANKSGSVKRRTLGQLAGLSPAIDVEPTPFPLCTMTGCSNFACV
jgi:hypothetical protein